MRATRTARAVQPLGQAVEAEIAKEEFGIVSLELAPDVAVVLGIVEAAPVAIDVSGPGLDAEAAALARELRGKFAGHAPAAITELAPARELYRAFGIDPTRTRPSSEALLRRALREDPLPRISNAVDLGNLLALRFFLPIGLYDLDRIDGRVLFRRGREREAYEGIRKEQVRLAGRPVLVDGRGPFGNPTSDSVRTSVGASTRALWMVIFAPRSYSASAMEAHVATARQAIERHLVPPGSAISISGGVRAQ